VASNVSCRDEFGALLVLLAPSLQSLASNPAIVLVLSSTRPSASGTAMSSLTLFHLGPWQLAPFQEPADRDHGPAKGCIKGLAVDKPLEILGDGQVSQFEIRIPRHGRSVV
jgi:hypothetical protein